MSFVNPIGLLLLLSIPVIVLLHLFRQERRRQEVSSLYLWHGISDQTSRRMHPRLLRNLNLLLQILAALFASLALAQPRITAGTASGADSLIIMIDDSASMQSSVGGVSRMELARNRAREVVGRAARGTQIMVVTAGPRPSIRQTFTTDRTLLYDVVRSMSATDGANDPEGAIRLIRGLGVGEETDIVFITDGAIDLAATTTLPAHLSIASVLDGQAAVTSANRAITSFELRARPDGSAVEVLAALANYGAEPASVTLQLSADDEVISTRTVEIDPDEERLITAVIPRVRGVLYRAELVGNEDALDVDDRAFAAAAGERPTRVQLVTAGNLFLESFLSVYPNVELTVTRSVEQSRPFDILILDNVPAPARLRGNVVALGTALPDGPFAPQTRRPLERAITSRVGHPLVAGVRLADVRIGEYTAGRLEPRATIVASTDEQPLLYTYRTDSLSLVGTTFALTGSDIALRSSFPVLMHNIVEWLAPASPTGEVGYARPGSVVPLYVPTGEEVTIVLPDETQLRFTPRSSPFEFGQTYQTGFYQVRAGAFVGRFAVSLADGSESDLRPRLVSAAGAQRDRPPADGSDREIWQWLALAALLLLTADWIVWARRHS